MFVWEREKEREREKKRCRQTIKKRLGKIKSYRFIINQKIITTI